MKSISYCIVGIQKYLQIKQLCTQKILNVLASMCNILPKQYESKSTIFTNAF